MTPTRALASNRMLGSVGFGDVSPLLQGAVSEDWFGYRARMLDTERASDSLASAMYDPTGRQRFEEWLSDDCPKLSGRAYAQYFWELDSWTEYWDLYHPETHGCYYFGDTDHTGYLRTFLPSPQRRRNPVFDSWKILAIYSGGEANPELNERFEAQARQPQVVEAVLAVDELVRRVVRTHFGKAGPLDALAYLDAMERFGKDTLPECPERFERVPENDFRKTSALHHTIEGDVMWFAWAVHLECAELVAPPDPDAHAVRSLLMAGVVQGCSFDFATRKRCRTRREYASGDAAAWLGIWSRARECSLDFSRGAKEVRELFRIREYGEAADHVPGPE